MDAQWTLAHLLKSKKIKTITSKYLYFCSISSSILTEYDHINTAYYSEQRNKLLILLI